MRRTVGIIRNGQYLAAAPKEREEVKSAFVHQDTMEALRHPVTGEILESKSAWNRVNRERGLTVVGNDLQSERKQELKEKITEDLILDRIEKAESIYFDPSKMRAREEENYRRIERAEKLLKWA